MKPLAALSLFAALCIAPAEAITVVPITFEELVAESTAVVYARVADVRGRWTADRRSIESLVTLESLRYLKGDLGDEVTMRLPGGEAAGLLQVLPGAPVLRAGDLVVLFLGARGPAIPSPVGLTQGVFRVTVDPRDGTALVMPPPLKASAAGRVIRGAADRRALTLDAFAQQVHAAAGVPK
jgi:hypothetical protein